MSTGVVKFIRKDGHVIPIRADGSHSVVSSRSEAIKKRRPAIKANSYAKFTSTAIAVVGGAVSGASFSHGVKAIVGTHVANHVGDVASTGLAFGAFAGKGRTKERLKSGAELEIKNQVLGWTAYGVTALGSQKGRAAVAGYARKGLNYAQKVIALGRKALRVA